MKNKIEIKNKIRVYRAVNNMTQEDLANLTGLAGNTIAFYESYRINPSVQSMRKISQVFNKKVEEMFDINGTWTEKEWKTYLE